MSDAGKPSQSMWEKLKDYAKRKEISIEKAKEKAEAVAGHVITAVEVAGTAGALGLLEGYREKPTEVAGVDASAIVAVAAHGLGFASGGKNEDHLHAIGNGAMAVYVNKMTIKLGKKLKEKKAETAKTAGELSYTGSHNVFPMGNTRSYAPQYQPQPAMVRHG